MNTKEKLKMLSSAIDQLMKLYYELSEEIPKLRFVETDCPPEAGQLKKTMKKLCL